MEYFAGMKPIVLIGGAMLVVIMLVSAVAFIGNKHELSEKHIEVVLRDIGHQLLLSAGDSTSRVLPVRKLDENSYQLAFENKVGFISDTVMNIVQRRFAQQALARKYIVNLKSCAQKETVLAFEINSETGDMTPCRGRRLAIGCYVIDINLLRDSKSNFLWWLLLLIPLGFAGYYLKEWLRPKETPATVTDHQDYVRVGIFQFYPATNQLKNAGTTIALSEKEKKALEIFVQHAPQVVEREQLMKAIWEDEGTIVISRNVDVLVSKLRKKLSEDPSLKLINVTGKGYKLIIEEMAG